MRSPANYNISPFLTANPHGKWLPPPEPVFSKVKPSRPNERATVRGFHLAVVRCFPQRSRFTFVSPPLGKHRALARALLVFSGCHGGEAGGRPLSGAFRTSHDGAKFGRRAEGQRFRAKSRAGRWLRAGQLGSENHSFLRIDGTTHDEEIIIVEVVPPPYQHGGRTHRRNKARRDIGIQSDGPQLLHKGS